MMEQIVGLVMRSDAFAVLRPCLVVLSVSVTVGGPNAPSPALTRFLDSYNT